MKRLLGSGEVKSNVRDQYRRLLVQCTEHFEYEEKLMEQTHYPHLARHKSDHRLHLKEGRRLLKQMEDAPRRSARSGYESWRGWFAAHVVAEDLAFGLFLHSDR